jgi:hypothetical protein
VVHTADERSGVDWIRLPKGITHGENAELNSRQRGGKLADKNQPLAIGGSDSNLRDPP